MSIVKKIDGWVAWLGKKIKIPQIKGSVVLSGPLIPEARLKEYQRAFGILPRKQAVIAFAKNKGISNEEAEKYFAKD